MHVAIDDSGITTGVPGFGVKTLAWSHISRIREIGGQLKLYGQPGDPTLQILSMVDDFLLIRDEIVRRCPGAFDKFTASTPAGQQTLELPLRVRVGWIRFIGEVIVGRLVMAAIGLALVVSGVIYPFVGDSTLSTIVWATLLTAIGLVIGGCALVPHWHALVVDRDRIELKSFGKTRVIRFASLQDVTLVTEQTTYHGVPLRADSVIYLVFPERKDSFALERFKFPNGTLHGYHLIKALFDDHRKIARR
jgi:hypothetical protein